MSSVSSATSNNVAYAAQKSYYSKLDSNSDGKLTEDEFVSGRPKNVSESQASTLYSKLDSDGTGSLTEDQFDQGMEDNKPSMGLESLMSSNAMAVLMLMSQQGGMSFNSSDSSSSSSSSTGGIGGSGGMPSIADLYADMDSDDDGSVTQAEFVAARPSDMSEDDANALYSSIDTENTGSITEEQFADSIKSAGPPQGGAPHGAGGAGGVPSSDEIYDALDTNKDGVVSETEFLTGHPADVTDDQASAAYDSIDTEGTGSITRQQFAEFMGDDATTDSSSADSASQIDLSSLSPNFSANGSNSIDDLLSMLQSMASSESETEAA